MQSEQMVQANSQLLVELIVFLFKFSADERYLYTNQKQYFAGLHLEQPFWM